jgi:hypothetical protein
MLGFPIDRPRRHKEPATVQPRDVYRSQDEVAQDLSQARSALAEFAEIELALDELTRPMRSEVKRVRRRLAETHVVEPDGDALIGVDFSAGAKAARKPLFAELDEMNAAYGPDIGEWKDAIRSTKQARKAVDFLVGALKRFKPPKEPRSVKAKYQMELF